jgi:hypothetical protein
VLNLPEFAPEAAERGGNFVYRSVNVAGRVNFVGITGSLELKRCQPFGKWQSNGHLEMIP